MLLKRSVGVARNSDVDVGGEWGECGRVAETGNSVE
jgi:hypothetical protein